MTKGITRRDMLRQIYGAIIAAGASSFISFEDLLAATKAPAKPALVWLHASSCSGCSISFMNVDEVPLLDVVTRFTRVLFHPDLSLATGHTVVEILEHLLGGHERFILVVEGGIPVGLPHACMMGERPVAEWISGLAARADTCVAAGTCATYGGVTTMKGSLTGSRTLTEFLGEQRIKTPVIGLPGCPMRPEHLLYTLLHVAHTGAAPELNDIGQPMRFFGRTVHERCVYYSDFQEKHFAKFIGDEGCLFELGCQGPVSHNDCVVNGYNGNTNSCIRAGHPCIGCTSELFPRQFMLHKHGDPRVLQQTPSGRKS